MTGALALALTLLLLNFLCGLSIPSQVILALLILFAVALVIYLLLKCPKCRCGWLFLLLWRVLFGVGLLLAIFAGCAGCNPWSFWIGLGLLILGIVFLLLWKKKCCIKLCALLKEVVFWIGVVVLPLVGLILSLGVGTACLFVVFSMSWPFVFVLTFYMVVLVLWALLLSYYLNNC